MVGILVGACDENGNDGNGLGDNNDKVDGNDAVVEYHVEESDEINHRLVWCW